MPQHKSAEKRMRTTARDKAKNRAVRGDIRRVTKDLKAVMATEKAEDQLRKVHSVLDKAVKKGVIPKNRANRRKARSARAVQQAKSGA
ncbi:MAG: 30S ribosomal protein S20 [Candidatus Eisenbacteria bacterium]|uniref:Small ribosomal subunit protein bS20 n=1 Tax=Eiseniibacteriota bacterium TaxID=2212470 RepID=A0A956RN56_UNCEI|nr:30S ribosomal protein S20 [Candidatus Eisenbacteria bacterium]